MDIIDKQNIRILVSVLRAWGVRRAVVSPGSRNAPVVLTLDDQEFDIKVVVDERSAAFIALGMAVALSEPVVLCCTSGSAVLNYGPALAEAYYRRVPLIVLTADRPAMSIDQRQGQTIRQTEALAAVVRDSVTIDEAMSQRDAIRLANRAVWSATGAIPGPVQINLPLHMPLTPTIDRSKAPTLPIGCKIARVTPDPLIVGEVMDEVYGQICDAPSVAIVDAQMGWNPELEKVLAKLEKAGIPVFAEVQANVHDLRKCGPMSKYPNADTVVFFGGPVVDENLKKWISESGRVVSIGCDDEPVDTFHNLAMTVNCEPFYFFVGLLHYIRKHKSTANQAYCTRVQKVEAKARPKVSPLIDPIANRLWMEYPSATVVLANGLTVREAQFSYWGGVRVEALRGVAGIDGQTSFAMGMSLARPDTLTVLITGDMGAAYDAGALATQGVGRKFKMVVIDNGGGGIFRAVDTTASLPAEVRNKYFVANPQMQLQALAAAYGFDYYYTDNFESYDRVLCQMLDSSNKAIMHVKFKQP